MKRQRYLHWRLPALTTLLLLPFPAHAGLVGYWKLDGNFDDSSGNDNNGELFGGAVYDADAPTVLGGGQSVSFDGQPGTYGAINPGSGLAITALPTYSVSMWVKGDGTLNRDKRVFSEGMSTNNNPLFNMGTHNTAADGSVDFYIRNGGGAETFGHAYSPGTAFDDTWHHIAFVSNDKIIDLYIDGELDGQFDYSVVPDFTPDTTTIGGILRAADCCNFLGKIDEVAVWDSALTAEEMARLARGTSAPEVGLPPEDGDEDGLPDSWETENNLDINDDGSVNPDNGPDGDPDNDNSSNAEEYANDTNPRDPDSDDDGLNDGGEVAAGTDPSNPDTDGDGLNDGAEGPAGTDPLVVDSDGDGVGDNDELTNGTDPADIESPSIADLLCAYWPLDSTDGSTTPDLGPNGYHLDLFGMDASNFVSDEGRAVASFEPLEGFLGRTHGEDDDLPITQYPAFTISMWVKITGLGQNDLRFFSESSTFNANPLFNLGTRNNGADNTLDVYLRDGGSPNHQFSVSEPLDGTWRHVAYTHNEANQTIQLYVDGVLDRDDWIFKDVISADVDTTTVGAILRADSSHWVEGMVDDVSLWKGVMSPAKIADLAAGATPDEIAGTAAFGISDINLDGDRNVSITWNSRPNTNYILEASLDIESGWLEIDDSVQSQGEETTYVLPAGTPGLDTNIETRIFFRVRR